MWNIHKILVTKPDKSIKKPKKQLGSKGILQGFSQDVSCRKHPQPSNPCEAPVAPVTKRAPVVPAPCDHEKLLESFQPQPAFRVNFLGPKNPGLRDQRIPKTDNLCQKIPLPETDVFFGPPLKKWVGFFPSSEILQTLPGGKPPIFRGNKCLSSMTCSAGDGLFTWAARGKAEPSWSSNDPIWS